MNEVRDGREGWVCDDCGAYLQWAKLNDGAEMLRCPWAREATWTVVPLVHHIEIHCGRPMSGRIVGGMKSDSVPA